MNRIVSIRASVLKSALCAALSLLAVSCAGRGESKQGDRFLAQGLFDKAVEMYQEAVQKNPGNEGYRQKLQAAKFHAAESHLEKGSVALEEMRLFDARAEFQTALRYRPQLEDASESLAKTRELIERITSEVRAARALMEQQKWFEAVDRLKPLRRYRADFPEADTMYARALDAAFTSSMDEGMAAYRREDFPLALSHFSKALALRAGDDRAGGMVKAAKRQITALEFCSEAAALLDGGDFRGAIRRYQSALNQVPGHAKAARGMQSAREYGAKTLLAQGTRALGEKRYIDAMTALDEAAGLLPDYPRLAGAHLKAKRAVADMVFACAEGYEGAGRHALAGASYAVVRLLAPNYPGLEKRLEATGKYIERASAYDLVLAFTGDAGLHVEFYNTLQGQLAGRGVQVLSTAEADAVKRLNPNYKPDGILTVSVGSVRVERTVAGRERRSVRYVSDTRIVVNEDYDLLRDELDRCRSKLQWSDSEVRSRRREVRRLRGERDRARDEWKAAAEDDPRKKKLHRRYIRLRDETRHAERLLDDMVREYDSWRYKVGDTERRLSNTPRYVKENIYSTYFYDVVTNRITAGGEATYGVADDLLGGELLTDSVKVKKSLEDKVVERFEPADIRSDPDELPSESTMRGNARDELIEELTERVAGGLRRFPLRYLRMAEAAEKAGRAEDAADYYVLYVFTCRALGLKQGMPRLAEVDNIVRLRTGYSVMHDAYDLSALKNIKPPAVEKAPEPELPKGEPKSRDEPPGGEPEQEGK